MHVYMAGKNMELSYIQQNMRSTMIIYKCIFGPHTLCSPSTAIRIRVAPIGLAISGRKEPAHLRHEEIEKWDNSLTEKCPYNVRDAAPSSCFVRQVR